MRIPKEIRLVLSNTTEILSRYNELLVLLEFTVIDTESTHIWFSLTSTFFSVKRLVFAELGAPSIPSSFSISRVNEVFDDNGKLVDERYDKIVV